MALTRASGVVWNTYGEARKKPAASNPAHARPASRQAAPPMTTAASSAATLETTRAGPTPGPSQAIGMDTR